MKRREFLQASLCAVSTGLAGCEAKNSKASLVAAPSATAAVTQSVGTNRQAVDLEVALSAVRGRVALLPGEPTTVLRYQAQVVRGAPDALLQNAASYLGPTIRVKRGQRVRVHFDNGIDEETIVHWHGLHLDEQNDGHPAYAIKPGQRFEYDFQVHNRAGTYWYHPHPADRTGPQVYQGMAGALVVTDDDEQRLGLPDGDRDLILVLQDRSFDAGNQLVYAPNRMVGFLGEQVLINGRPMQTMELPRGPHRLRVINGSNSRIYDLAWSDGSPLTILGTDGGLLAAPSRRAHVVLAPAQRLDIWVNFGADQANDVWLESRAFEDPSPMMGGGMMGRGMMGGGSTGLPQGSPLRLQRFIARGNAVSASPPDKLISAPARSETEVRHVKQFNVGMSRMRWLLNDRDFEMHDVAPNERVRLGTVEDWEFVNAGQMMAMPHPIHLHGPQFRIVSRNAGPGATALRQGLFDEGWLDTFLLLPGDRVRIRMKFERYTGLYLYHCHNLEHEDLGMMRNYRVEPS